MASEAKNNIDMLNGPLLGKLALFAIPLILSGVLQLLFNAADIIVVGKFAGTESLAAVGSTGSLINLITNLFIGLAVGTNVVMAKAIGARNIDKAGRITHTSILVALVGGVLVALVGFFMSRIFLDLMKTDAEVIDKATLYLEIYFLGSPASILYNFGASLLRAKGDTKRPLYFLLASGVLNVLLNLLFVIVFRMDVAGVALATIISQTLSAVLVVVCLFREKDYCRLRLKKLKVSLKELGEIVRVGLPAGIYGSLFSISNVIIQSAVNGFGKEVMAGNSAASNLEGFVHTSMVAIYSAAVTFTGQNYGAKKYDRIKKIFADCVLLVVSVGVIMGFSFLFAGRHLSSLYSDDPEVISYSIVRLKIIMPTYFLCGVMDVLVGVLRGMGYSVLPTLVSLTGACAFRIIWVYSVFKVWHTLPVLYISYPVSWVLTGTAHFVTFLIVYSRLKKRLALEKAAAAQERQAEEESHVPESATGEVIQGALPVSVQSDEVVLEQGGDEGAAEEVTDQKSA